ncbi:MAG: site-specific integrase, partial [Deltaproteobacteria bacterium]|nr:site-specific integrase [Deltaproteobacteria bacterium]
MEKLIEQYENHLQNERHVSPHTLRNYVSDLRQFQEFVKSQGVGEGEGGSGRYPWADPHCVRA